MSSASDTSHKDNNQHTESIIAHLMDLRAEAESMPLRNLETNSVLERDRRQHVECGNIETSKQSRTQIWHENGAYKSSVKYGGRTPEKRLSRKVTSCASIGEGRHEHGEHGEHGLGFLITPKGCQPFSSQTSSIYPSQCNVTTNRGLKLLEFVRCPKFLDLTNLKDGAHGTFISGNTTSDWVYHVE